MAVIALLIPLLWALALVYGLWAFYLAVMALKRAKDANMLSPTARALGMPIAAVGLLLDFVVNTLVVTVLLLELPRETTVTARLKRHIRDMRLAKLADGRTKRLWRGALAQWICVNMLDVFDPSGSHCDCGLPPEQPGEGGAGP